MKSHDMLVAPVIEAGAETREVYLPAGEKWLEVSTGKVYVGGQTVTAKAPIEVIPVFVKDGSKACEYVGKLEL